MKKIGIVTMFSYYNYGNRLQMYAVQEIYSKLGFTSEVIKYKEKKYREPWLIRTKVIVKFLMHFKSNIVQFYLKRCRIYNGRKHSLGLYNESEKIIDPKAIDNAFHEQYSFVSVGSDQIWGWYFSAIPDFVFLRFAPRSKRIAFSPSFGGDILGIEYQDVFAEGINGMNSVSVREASGAKIVKELTGRDVQVLCDPTMCLTKDEWLSFSRRHKKKPNKKYILTYFLGSRPKKVNDVLNKYSANYDVVHLNSFEDPVFYAANPSEWIDFIEDAALFLTDSFHGVVFSILLQTSFSVYSRVGGESMHTRIIHILDKFELENRFEMGPEHASLFGMDFSRTAKVVELEKEKALAFLKNALGINQDE